MLLCNTKFALVTSAALVILLLIHASAFAEEPESWLVKYPEIAERYGHDPALILALIKVESNRNSQAVSPVGARGLMQVMPDTWEETRERLGLSEEEWGFETAAFDPIKNIEIGSAYLQWLKRHLRNKADALDKEWKASWPQIGLAAYNAGPGAVIDNNFGIPPIAETQRYVPDVMSWFHPVGEKFWTRGCRLHVRSRPDSESTKAGSIRKLGTAGEVLEGPEISDGLVWWRIKYDDGVEGWSVDKCLRVFQGTPTTLSVGDSVKTTVRTNVRVAPCTREDRCSRVNEQPAGTTGTIIPFPAPKPRVVNGYNWWKVEYDDGTVGWTVESALELVTARPEVEDLTLQEAVSRGLVKLRSKGEFFGDGVTFIGTGQNTEDVIVEVRVGDAILTKNPNRQDLVVTQSRDILLPAGEEIRKKGIWVACLDSGKSAPQEGEELDVTTNLAEWPQQLAHELLNKLREQEGSISQDAVWQISDRENFPEVSNPVRSSPGSRFTSSPELTLASIIAKHVDNCPKAKSDPDTIICRREIKFATWLYYSEQDVPGTTQRKIDLQTLRKMVSFYVTQTPTNHPPAGVRRQQVDAQLQELLKRARPTPLSLNDVAVVPNPIGATETARFLVRGTGIESVNINIYNLSGGNIFSSGRVVGNTFIWHLRTDHGSVVANGIYLYRMTIRGAEGQVTRSEVKKLVVLR